MSNSKMLNDNASSTVTIDRKRSQTTVNLSKFTQKLWNTIKDAFKTDREPTFRQRPDCDGIYYWEAYDPASGRTIYFGSDDEARLWLDQSRPYR